MITKEVNKFMALAPLMLPRLIDSKKEVEFVIHCISINFITNGRKVTALIL